MGTPIVELTSDIVAAYIAHNSVASYDLAELIVQTHRALDRIARGETAAAIDAPKLVPAVPVRKSVTPDFLISLEDGKKYKSLKRHLSSKYDMSPAEYRRKWGLPDDYPMVALNYSKQRSELAKSAGLGLRQTARNKAPSK